MKSELEQLLGGTSLCRGFSDDEIERLAGAGRIEHWSRGAHLMEEGAESPRLVVLLQGSVEIFKNDVSGQEHLIGRVSRGGILGELSLLTEKPRDATVRALERLRVFAMDRSTFLEMVEDRDPAALKLGLSIAIVLAGRLQELNRKMVEVLERDAQNKVVKEFDDFREALFSRWDF